MLPLYSKQILLQDIKDSLKDVIPEKVQDFSSYPMTDKMRHHILDTLISYADKIPHPASGNAGHNKNLTTFIRWQILAYVAGIDLTIAKWFESHLDALSILHEIGCDIPDQGLWAVWAAEGYPLDYQQGIVNGKKAWCSGANIVDYGLMTYRDGQGHSQLVIVDMQQDGIEIDNTKWQAVGMQATHTATIKFTQVTVTKVGAANAYLDRVGFWHGAAGVAACWYGATTRLAEYLMKAYEQKPNDYKAMYLGEISTALAVTQPFFHHVATLIDSQPHLSHELAIRQLRANVEQLSRQVLDTVGQALGAAPFCHNAHFARLSADLPVFIRQSHGAFDLRKIGELSCDLASQLTDNQENIWQL